MKLFDEPTRGSRNRLAPSSSLTAVEKDKIALNVRSVITLFLLLDGAAAATVVHPRIHPSNPFLPGSLLPPKSQNATPLFFLFFLIVLLAHYVLR